MALQFLETSHGGVTVFMLADDDGPEAVKRVRDAGVPVGISKYAQTTVITVDAQYAAQVRAELKR